MANQDWERFGEEIRRTVQEAVSSRNFDKLNQMVTNTVNDAADGIMKTLKNVGETAAGAGRRGGNAGNAGRYQGPVYKQEQPPAYSCRNPVSLYRETGSVKVGGTILSGVGLALGCISVFLFLIFLIYVYAGGGFGRIDFIMMVLSLSGTLVGFTMYELGAGIKKRVMRFRSYIRILGNREYCNIRELAERTGKSVKYVTKDLERLLLGGWFLQGHMDEEKSCLIVSNDMYEQYLSLQAERRRVEAAEASMRRFEEQRREQRKSYRKISPDVRAVIEEGEEYIRKIRACRAAIPDSEMSAKISRMETVIHRIFDKVEHSPEDVEDIRRMMDYYLPTTVKLLEAYQELNAQPVEGENIRSSKLEIEKTLDTLNAAFEKLLDNLFQDTAWDVSSDISVLHTMLAQEGLAEDELGVR